MAPLSELPGAISSQTSGQDPPDIRVTPPGPMSIMAANRLHRVECPAFRRRRAERAAMAEVDEWPIVLASGKGSNLYDVDGNCYVDLAAGFGALLLGHSATAVAHAIEGQADRLVQGLGDVYPSDTKVALLEKLARLHPGDSPMVLLEQSGGGAVTAAIKTATLATGRPGIIGFDGAYHGLGFAPLAICGFRASFREPFAAQLNPHARFVPYPGYRGATDEASLEFLQQELEAGDIGAVVLEPVLGRGGCVVPPDGFAAQVCELAHRHGALVIADEIWTGLGRSGAMIRTTELGAPVDLICLGKGLGGGVAIAACIGPEPIMKAWAKDPGVIHTSTHSGAPLACAGAVATLDAVRVKKLAERSREVGERLRQRLAQQLSGCERVVEIRGAGLLVGVQLDSATTAMTAVHALLRHGYVVLTGGLQGEVLTLTPALTIDEPLLEGFAESLAEVLSE